MQCLWRLELEDGWSCRDRRQGCAEGCESDVGAGGDGGEVGEERKLEAAMEPDWCTVKHPGVGPKEVEVKKDKKKAKGAKKAKRKKEGQLKAKVKAKGGTVRQVDRSPDVGEVFVFMFMYLSSLWRWIVEGGTYVCGYVCVCVSEDVCVCLKMCAGVCGLMQTHLFFRCVEKPSSFL